MRAAGAENWTRAYREAPDVFDAFAKAEDPEGLIAARLLAHAELALQSVLEIGCGSGRLLERIASETALCVGIEPEPRMLALARERHRNTGARCSLVQARAESLPIADRSVDSVLAAWVLIGLPPRRLSRVLDETTRVLTGGTNSGLWVIESHWSGEFHALRGPRRQVEKNRIEGLIATRGFRAVEVVRTELRFRTAGQAAAVLGYLCGAETRERFLQAPKAALSHDVIILHRPAQQRQSRTRKRNRS